MWLDKLNEVYNECRYPDWHGYGSLPVEYLTVKNVEEIIKSLPLDIPPPTFGADPDGMITIEWHVDYYNTISISVDIESNLFFAAMINGISFNGSITSNKTIPKIITELIYKVLENKKGDDKN